MRKRNRFHIWTIFSSSISLSQFFSSFSLSLRLLNFILFGSLWCIMYQNKKTTNYFFLLFCTLRMVYVVLFSSSSAFKDSHKERKKKKQLCCRYRDAIAPNDSRCAKQNKCLPMPMYLKCKRGREEKKRRKTFFEFCCWQIIGFAFRDLRKIVCLTGVSVFQIWFSFDAVFSLFMYIIKLAGR